MYLMKVIQLTAFQENKLDNMKRMLNIFLKIDKAMKVLVELRTKLDKLELAPFLKRN